MQKALDYCKDYVSFLTAHVPAYVWISLGFILLVLWYWQKLRAGLLGLGAVLYILGGAYIVQKEFATFDNPAPFVVFMVGGIIFTILLMYVFFVRPES